MIPVFDYMYVISLGLLTFSCYSVALVWLLFKIRGKL